VADQECAAGAHRQRLDPALNQRLAGLRAAHDQQGWRVKDHLTHIAAWEQSLLALLEGRDRWAS